MQRCTEAFLRPPSLRCIPSVACKRDDERANRERQIVGPAGVGKTQFCLQMAVQACLPKEEGGLGGTVVYIDTESAFSPKRYDLSDVFSLMRDSSSLRASV